MPMMGHNNAEQAGMNRGSLPQMSYEITLLTLVMISLFCLLSSVLWGEMIVDIKVEGIKRVDSDVVISTSGLEIGDELTPQNVKEAVKRLYESRLFEDIRIEREEEGGGARITIYVEECPIISKIEFEGNKKFNSDKLEEICGLKERAIGGSADIFDAGVRIRKAYEKEGYYLVEVTPDIKEQDGKVSVKYLIEEGKRVKIREVEIIGNNAFSDKCLKRKLKNKAKYWWWWSGKFNKEEFEGDPERIIEYYHANGYPNCKLIKVEITPNEIWRMQDEKWIIENREWITIKIEINEGEKFYFGDVEFEGNEVIGTKDLRGELRFKKNEPYSDTKMRRTMEGISGLYYDIGYLYVNIEPVEEVVDSIANIVYKLREGEPARVHKIIIQDNVKTHEKVIRRELTIFPGEIFSRKKLIASQHKVYNLGFFKNILIDTKQANPQGDIDLILKVEEKEAGTASFGASYYPKYGFVGNFSLSAPNFRGLGEHVYIRIEKGEKVQTLACGYTKPWLFDTPLTAGLNLYHTLEGRYWYKMRKTGGRISFSRLIPGLTYTKGRLSYSLEGVKVSELTDTTLLPRIPQGLRSEAVFGLDRDSRDNFLNPTVGTRNDVEIELSGGLLGGEVNYHKQVFETSTYHKLWWKFVLGLRGKLGIVNGYRSPAEVPLYERFVLGGIGRWGLRGYRDWSVGPKSGKEVIGGRFASIFTIEVKIAFPHNIYPLVFFDAGNAWECLIDANFQDLKRGAGVGFRIEIPMMGLVGFDLGYRIDPTVIQPRRGWEFHLQMGRKF